MIIAKGQADDWSIKSTSLSNGGRILYTYNNTDKYFENAVNFILEGLEHNQNIIFLESNERLRLVRNLLNQKGISCKKLNRIHFFDVMEIRNQYGDLDVTKTTFELSNIANQIFTNDKQLRLWVSLYYTEKRTLERYHSILNQFVYQYNIISVSAMNGHTNSAATLAEWLKIHNYFMTDEAIVPSNVSGERTITSPSIIEQINLEQTAEDEMIRSEQLSFAGQFAAGICHEIRNPLTTIKGFFQLIKENHNKETYFQVIDEELNRIEQITSELLLLAKPHSSHKDKHNLIHLVNNVILLLKSQAIMKSIAIDKEFDVDKLLIECEDTKIKQVLINILKNAIEVMDHGRIIISATSVDGYAQLAITDEGPGIPEEILSKIGQPFFTTKKKGTGLGLMICFNIIKNHNGKIQVASNEGEGTTFTISLPLVN